MLAVQYRPMSDTTWKRKSRERRTSQFTSDWNGTMKLLEKEINALDGTDVTFELEVLPAAIRADGTGLLAHQRPVSEAVIVSFETKKHGTQVHQGDAFTKPTWRNTEGWRQNVHAVAKTLEALRAVERYGASAGQQYTGFKALPVGPTRVLPTMTTLEATNVLRAAAHDDSTTPTTIHDRWKRARAATHPDRHEGRRVLWDEVEEAATVLGLTT